MTRHFFLNLSDKFSHKTLTKDSSILDDNIVLQEQHKTCMGLIMSKVNTMEDKFKFMGLGMGQFRGIERKQLYHLD